MAWQGARFVGGLAGGWGKPPPHPNDYPILFRMRQIGLKPGKPFDASKLDPALVKTINTAASDALKDIEQACKTGEGLTKVNGWFYTAQTVGTYGTAFHPPPLATFIGLGVNLPEDAIYPASFMDSDGKPES